MKKAGRAQLIGWGAAALAGTVWGKAHPEVVQVVKDNAEAVIGGLVVIVTAIAGAVDADKVLDANAQKARAARASEEERR